MQALGMIETKGLLAAIEAVDTMLKAADVNFMDKQKVGGGRVTVLVAGDVGAVKAAVDAGVTAVEQLGSKILLSCHVIARPHEETAKLFAKPEEVLAETALPTAAEPSPEMIPAEAEMPVETKPESKARANTKNNKKTETETKKE